MTMSPPFIDQRPVPHRVSRDLVGLVGQILSERGMELNVDEEAIFGGNPDEMMDADENVEESNRVTQDLLQKTEEFSSDSEMDAEGSSRHAITPYSDDDNLNTGDFLRALSSPSSQEQRVPVSRDEPVAVRQTEAVTPPRHSMPLDDRSFSEHIWGMRRLGHEILADFHLLMGADSIPKAQDLLVELDKTALAHLHLVKQLKEQCANAERQEQVLDAKRLASRLRYLPEDDEAFEQSFDCLTGYNNIVARTFTSTE